MMNQQLTQQIKLIVGLRNPGAAYEHTRHNAGGWFLDAFAKADALTFKSDKKWPGELATFTHDGVSCMALLPLTFMNHSGQAVRAVSQFYRIEPHEILVAHDELDLPVGSIKLKSGGGHGGHNGLRDIITHLGTTAFQRLRIGIGHPGDKTLVLDYVLGKPRASDKILIDDAMARGIKVLPDMLAGRMDIAMNRLNS